VVLINLVGTIVIGGGMGLLHYAVAHAFGAWVLAWAVGMLLASAAVSYVTLPAAARFLDERREDVLLAMR
jgi:hypothetical protein